MGDEEETGNGEQDVDPVVDDYTDEELRELGMTVAEIAELRKDSEEIETAQQAAAEVEASERAVNEAEEVSNASEENGREEEEEDDRPIYMKDDAPTGKTNYIKWALLHGKLEDELRSEGLNTRTVDICAQELEKDGYRKRPEKDKEKPPGRGTSVVVTPSRGIQTFAKGSPPEALIDSLTMPIEDGEGPIFEKGMKFGMTVLTLGVRIAQELTNAGVQQAKPLIEMAKDMRAGEVAAAKNAAGEAAMLAAATVQQNMAPTLAALTESQKSTGPNPMGGMMARTMEPIMQRMMNQLLPGGEAPIPSGWKKTKG